MRCISCGEQTSGMRTGRTLMAVCPECQNLAERGHERSRDSRPTPKRSGGAPHIYSEGSLPKGAVLGL